jgi:alcohol oxidase
MTVAQSLQYPFSRGSIHITSSDIHSPPAFDAGFLSHPADLAPQVWAYKTMREITRRMPSFRGEIEATHPQFPRGSMAACISSYTPFVKDVVYSSKDNETIEHWVRSKVETTWHSSYAPGPGSPLNEDS